MSGYRGFDGPEWKRKMEIEQNEFDRYKEYVR